MAAFSARYARAFAAVVEEAKLDPSQVSQQLQDFANTLAGSGQLREVLLNPSIPTKKRVAILDAVNARVGCSTKVRNFLAVLISHERLSSLHEILQAYSAEMNRRLGIVDASITTARKLGDAERHELEQRVTDLAGTPVRAAFHEDRLLIGGAIVRIGSTIYDGSVRGRLQRLKDQLTAD